MSSKAPRLVVDALSIVLPGGVALWVLGRTLAVYWGRDTIASTILIAMAVSLVCGLLELALRVRRAQQLESEVRALPASPSEATIDGASPLLSTLLRGRIEQGAPLSLGDSVAPYLTGLLVMLGLLGTLLGLFETIHGAGDALTTSADVAALRRSLTTPIDGLRRSFGCSAAGISASALLGLAVALVRRREGRALRAIHVYAAGPLRVLSPVRRQARAVEQLVTQGAVLPDSARALEQVGAQLEALSGRLVGLQEAALDGQKHALSALLEGVRSELAKVATDTGAALSERVSPIVAQLVERTGETALAQANALSATALDLTRALESDRDARREAEQARELALSRRLDEAERTRAEAHAAELEALTGLARRAVEESEQREATLAARWQTLTSQLEQALRTVHDDDARRHAELDALAARVGDSLSGLAGRVGESLDVLAGKLDAQLGRRLESEHAHELRAQHAMAQLGEAAARVEAGSSQAGDALEALVARLPPLFSEVAEAAQASAGEAIQRLSARAEEAQAAAHAQLEVLVTRTEAHLTTLVEQLDRERAERAERERAHDERAQRTTDRLAESAGAVEAMIAGQREGLEGLVTRVGALFEQLGAASRAGAEATLARLSESADRQVERFAALEQKLAEARSEQAVELGRALTTQSEQLEQKLAQAFTAVQEAAATWRASSVEMQAIADLFARSIERQRELSDTFIESLGDIEGAVERAGKHAAADALSDQLASTQEVFARQLQFQRELFEQLRTLRGGGHRAHGEHDVSV